MLKQLEISGAQERKELFFHKKLLKDELPLTIGGGIGQSRLCMFFLRKDTVDLLEFNKMITVLAVILLMVSAIDFISDRLRYLILDTKREGFETLPANN